MEKDHPEHIQLEVNKQLKYEHWRRLSRANEEYRNNHDHRKDFENEQIGFYRWMRDRWGIEIGKESGAYSASYAIIDRKKYMLFCIRYS